MTTNSRNFKAVVGSQPTEVSEVMPVTIIGKFDETVNAKLLQQTGYLAGVFVGQMFPFSIFEQQQ